MSGGCLEGVWRLESVLKVLEKCIKSGLIKSGQVRTGQVKSGKVRSSKDRSSQDNNNSNNNPPNFHQKGRPYVSGRRLEGVK